MRAGRRRLVLRRLVRLRRRRFRILAGRLRRFRFFTSLGRLLRLRRRLERLGGRDRLTAGGAANERVALVGR